MAVRVRNVRISRELYDRMGDVAAGMGSDRADVARRALRRYRRCGMGEVDAVLRRRDRERVVRGENRARTTIVLRLVDLGRLDRGLGHEALGRVLDALVPTPDELEKETGRPNAAARGPDEMEEAGFRFRRDGRCVGMANRE